MNSFKNNDYIDLLEIARSVWVHKFLLIALAVVIAIISVVRVEFFTKDRYVAYGMLYVSNTEEVEEGEMSKNALETARSMVSTCREILNTRSFLSKVSRDIGGGYSWGQIKGMTSITSVNETEIVRIAVSAYSPKDAYLIAESIVRNAPEELDRIFKSGNAEIIDEVTLPGAPVGKGTMGEAVKGAIIGIFIGLVIIVVLNLFDTKIHKSEDVAKRYNVSILGEIAQ